MSKLKHLAAAAALIGLATQVQAGYFPGSTDFEDNPLTNTVIWSGIDDVTQAIVPDATVPSPRPATYTPPSFSTTRANVLSVDNEASSPIVCNINAGAAMPASTIYADFLIKSYPLANDAPAPEVGPTDKLLVYTRVNAAGTDTNLCVLARPDANSITNESVITSTHIGKDEWHRIIIEAVDDGTYKVYCDTFGQNAALGTYYPINAVAQGSASMSNVAFAGSAYLDDLILSTFIPDLPITTLTWDTSFASVSYVVGNATNALNVADGSYEFQPAGPVTLIGDTGYRTFTTSGSAGSTVTLAAPTGIAKYFPQSATAGQDGTAGHPYEIPDIAALNALKDMVNNETNCTDLCFVQTADIALTNAWEGIGVKGGKDLVHGDDKNIPRYEQKAFAGTYDGGNFTISNFQMENGTDYGALFNSVNGATIKNLKITWGATTLCANSSADGSDTGATFVGVARESTLSNLTALVGANVVVSASKDFGGIVGYLMAGSTVDSCTNELNVASLKGGRKCGGIAIITEDGSGTATIRNCKNSGTCSGGSYDGAIVGYIGVATAIIGCENTANAPLLTCQAGTVTVSGGTKSVAYRTPFVKNGGTVNGLNFAIVDGDVATFVEDNALAAGNTYKVMADGATATYNFTAPGTIAFDTELFSPTYAITAAQGLALTDATSGNVKTYTAAIAAATWIGGASGAWNDASNWSGGFVPTNTTVATFTNSAQVAISATDACSGVVLSNANVKVVRANGVDAPILRFYGNGDSAVSVASGATGSFAVSGLALFNERKNETDLTIGCAFEVLDAITFRGISIVSDSTSASFTITGKTTISRNALVKTIDYGTTKFQGGIEVAKGVTAKISTPSHGGAQIGTGVTLVANDGAGAHTAIWLMKTTGTASRGVSLVNDASIVVDADHAATFYTKMGAGTENGFTCDIYEVCPKPTVIIVAEDGATLTGVTNGVPVTPGAVLSIGATGAAQGAEVTLTISNRVNNTVVTTTELPYSYTMQEYDAYVSVAAVQAPQGFNDPQGTPIEDPAVLDWLRDNGFTQADINALGNNYAALEKFYEAYIVNYDFRVPGAGVALSFTDITVTNDISVTVQLVRTAPLGPLHGKLYIYGATDLTAGFGERPIVDTSVTFTGDETFATQATEGTVTQTVTATLRFVSDKFFQAQIHAELPDNGEY